MVFKRICRWSCLILLLGWVLYAASQMLSANLYAFSELLYIRHNNISVSSLFISLLSRHSLFIVAFMFALMFLTIHIVTATGIDDIIRCVPLMLSAAGYTVCGWNQHVLFMAPAWRRQIFLHTHDTMLLMFAVALFQMIIPRLVSRVSLRRALQWGIEALFLAGALLLWRLPPVRGRAVLIPSAILMGLLCLFMIALQFRNGFRLQNTIEALLPLLPCLLMVVRSLYLFDLQATLREYYIDYAGAVIVVYGIGLSLYTLLWQLSNLFLRRSENRRFEEIVRIRTDVSNLLVNYCQPPARQIAALSRIALDESHGALNRTQKQILYEMQDEVNKLSRRLRNIGEYETLPAATPAMQMQPIRLGTMYNYVMNEIAEPIIMLDNAQQWLSLYGMGEPYSLIRAISQLCAAISQIRGEEKIHIACRRDGHFIVTEISAAFPQARLSQARHICRVVNKGNLISGVRQETDMALYSIHSILSRHGSPPRADILCAEGRYLLRVNYHIQHCAEPEEPIAHPKVVSRLERDDDDPARKVLLLSTSTEEIDLICSYLAYEPYQVVVMSSEKALLCSLSELRQIATLIIGTTFMDSSIYEICAMVRERYTLGQLPILLVQRDPGLHTHFAAQKLANSIITALSDRFEFCQRVHTLVELQASVQSTFASRLAFLQAQMNPHFIFNTINTIMALCLNKPMEAYDLLENFSRYLRSSLFSRDLDKPYPVYEEVDLLMAYLSMEKARFKEQIVYEVISEVPDDWQILPMLIEPLVENSVKHGKRPNAPLNIRVELTAQEGALHVLVQDDGMGFDPDEKARLAVEAQKHNRSIGLENVRTRLDLYYNAPLVIESVPEQGTRVSFVLEGMS